METTESYAPTGCSYYAWWFPGSPVRVHLALEVIRRLRERLQLDQKMTGEGLLFGKVAEAATEVLDFQPAAGRVLEAIASLCRDGGQPMLVGYYRIELSDSLRLTGADLELAQACFTKPYEVFLVIQPTGFGPPNASFFFHDKNGKMAEFSLLEFPFDPSLLAGEERERLRRSHKAAATRLAAPELSAPQPTAPGRRSGGRRMVVAGLILVGFLSAGWGISTNRGALQTWWSRPSRETPVDPTAVPTLSLATGLRAKRENGDVQITWNR